MQKVKRREIKWRINVHTALFGVVLDQTYKRKIVIKESFERIFANVIYHSIQGVTRRLCNEILLKILSKTEIV